MLLVLCALMSAADAKPFLITPDRTEDVDITQHVGIYYDYTKALDLEQVRLIKNNNFLALDGIVSDGFRDAHIWVRFYLDMATAKHTTWYLYDKWFSSDYVTFYHIDNNGAINEQQNGILTNSQPAYDSRKITFKIDNNDGNASGEYYLKMNIKVPVLYGFGIATEKEYSENIAEENLILGAYFGGMIIIIFHALVMSRVSSLFLYFSAFSASIAYWNFVLNGFRKQYLGSAVTLNDIFALEIENPATAINYAAVAIIITFTLFARKLFVNEKIHHGYRKFIDLTFYIGLFVCVLLFFVRQEAAILLGYAYHTLAVAQFCFLSLWVVLFKDRSMKNILITVPFLVMFLGLILSNLSSLGYLQSGFIACYGVQLTSIFYLAVFSVILSNRSMEVQRIADRETSKSKGHKIKQAAINRIVERFTGDLQPKIEQISELCDPTVKSSEYSQTVNLKNIDSIAKNVSRAFHRLSELVRVEFDESENQNDAIEIRQVMQNIHGQYIELAYSSNINFTYQLSDDVPKVVYGDGERLQKVIECICENALLHSGTDRAFIKSTMESKQGNELALCFEVIDFGNVDIDRNILDAMRDISEGNMKAVHRLPSEYIGMRIIAEVVNHLNGRIVFEYRDPGLTVTVKLMFGVEKSE